MIVFSTSESCIDLFIATTRLCENRPHKNTVVVAFGKKDHDGRILLQQVDQRWSVIGFLLDFERGALTPVHTPKWFEKN